MKYLNFIYLIMCCCFTTSCFDEVTADIGPVSVFDFDSTEEFITMEDIDIIPTGQTGVYRAEGIVYLDKDQLPEAYQNGIVRYYWRNSYIGDIPVADFPVTMSESLYSGETRCFQFELRAGGDIARPSNDFCATAP